MIFVLLPAFIFPFSCGSYQDEQAQQQTSLDVDEDLDDPDDMGAELFEEGKLPPDPSGKLPHPASATMWSTKALLLSYQKPSQEKLDTCAEEIFELTKQVINAQSLVMTAKKISSEVSRLKPLYHWCFYTILGALEGKLLNDGLGLLLQEKASAFQKNFKALWILATTLDSGSSRKIYFSFLRKRYIELSRDFFGRDLDVFRNIGKGSGFSIKKPRGAQEYED